MPTMQGLARATPRRVGGRFSRSLAALVAAFLYLVAQSLFAAHANTPIEDLKGHSAAECAVCMAGGVADDPATNAPAMTVPASRLKAQKTSIPAALHTETTVRAASPRAPPSA